MTLMDVVVGLALMTVAALGIFAGFKGALTGWTVAQQVTAESHNARFVLEYVARLLRMAGNEYAGGPPLAVTHPDEIVFLGNTDDDPQVECYSIYRDGQGVVRIFVMELAGADPPPAACTGARAAGAGQPLTTQVEARDITVEDLRLSYSPTLLPRRVTLEIRVRGVQSPGPLTMSTQVFLRVGQ